MPEVLVLNPRRRRNRLGRFTKGSARKSRRRRNPIAALAANPRRRRRRHVSRRRRNPIALAANPRRRRRHARSAVAVRSTRRRRNPRATRRRYRRNPSAMGGFKSMLSLRGLTNTLVPAAIGGAGALGVDLALSYMPGLPEWFSTPTGKIVARVVGAIGVGVIAGMLTNRRTGALVTSGALTVTAYGAIKSFAVQTFPQLAGISPPEYGDFSDTRLGYLDPAPRLGAYMQRNVGVGAYMQRNTGVGAYMRDSLDNVNSLSGVTHDGM